MKKVGIFLLILLLIPGCRKTVTEEQMGDDSVLAYYVNAAMTRLTGDAHKLQAADLSGRIEELYAVLQESGHGETVAAVPESLKLISQNVDSRILSLDLEGPYYEMSTASQVMCLAALTKTMTQLEEVDYIRLSVNGSPVTQGETEVGILRSGMFMDDIKDNPDSYIDTELVLYFASEDGRQLVKTTLSVGYQSGSSLERIVVEQLLRGPQVSGVLGVNVRDGICYVNFDDKFISDSLSGGYDYIPVYSLVNSLTELPTVQKVQLMINSKTDVSYSDNISFAAPLERNMDYVGGEID